MWNENYIDSGRQEDTAKQVRQMSEEFLRSLRPQPGCEKNGVCNECGLCEH